MGQDLGQDLRKDPGKDLGTAPPDPPASRLHDVLAVYPGLSAPRSEPLGHGLMHQTFAVHDPSGAYVLQRVHAMFDPGIHANIAAVTAHLMSRGVPTPRLLPTRDGALFHRDDEGRCWRLLTRVAGFTLDRCPDAGHARSAAILVARFHAALRDLSHPFRPLGIVLHDTDAHLRTLRSALDEHRAHPLHAHVVPLAEEIAAVADAWPRLEGLPLRAAHGDLKFNNVLFQSNGGSSGDDVAHALIDLDTVGPLPLWVELGDAWRSWCNRRPDDEGVAELDLGLWRAAVEGYLEHTDLELAGEELASLAQAVERISLELAARFAADVLQERHFAWDPARFTRAGEHHLKRARAQLDLCRQARATRSEQMRFLRG